MNRREFITLVGTAAAWPLYARAEERVRVVGLLTGLFEDDPEYGARISAFRRALKDLGWIEGNNLRFEARLSGNLPERIPSLAAELVQASLDVIYCMGTPGTIAVQRATNTIPIVFSQVTDPVGGGIVANLFRPGGNITGFTNYEYSIGGKWLALLKELVPELERVLFVINEKNTGWSGLADAIGAAAKTLGIKLVLARVHDDENVTREITAFARQPHGSIIAQPDGLVMTHRDRIIKLAELYHLPAIGPERAFVASGGLLFYGVDSIDLSRRAAGYVNRILRGERPGDLPVQAPTKFDLVINLKTARTLGISAPQSLLVATDEVIE